MKARTSSGHVALVSSSLSAALATALIVGNFTPLLLDSSPLAARVTHAAVRGGLVAFNVFDPSYDVGDEGGDNTDNFYPGTAANHSSQSSSENYRPAASSASSSSEIRFEFDKSSVSSHSSLSTIASKSSASSSKASSATGGFTNTFSSHSSASSTIEFNFPNFFSSASLARSSLSSDASGILNGINNSSRSSTAGKSSSSIVTFFPMGTSSVSSVMQSSRAGGAQGTNDGTTDTLGCFDVNGFWTMDRSACAQPVDQAGFLGIPTMETTVDEEEFLQKTNDYFAAVESPELERKVEAVHTIIQESITRIDDLIAKPADLGLSEEQAVLMRDRLMQQQQSVSPENVEEVLPQIRETLREIYGPTLFPRLERIRAMLTNAITVFDAQGLSLNRSLIDTFTHTTTDIQTDECIAQSMDCPQIDLFLEAAAALRDHMQELAIREGKSSILQTIDSSLHQ